MKEEYELVIYRREKGKSLWKDGYSFFIISEI